MINLPVQKVSLWCCEWLLVLDQYWECLRLSWEVHLRAPGLMWVETQLLWIFQLLSFCVNLELCMNWDVKALCWPVCGSLDTKPPAKKEKCIAAKQFVYCFYWSHSNNLTTNYRCGLVTANSLHSLICNNNNVIIKPNLGLNWVRVIHRLKKLGYKHWSVSW